MVDKRGTIWPVSVNAAIDAKPATRRLRIVRLDEMGLPPLIDATLEGVPVRDALLACFREPPARQRAVWFSATSMT